MFWESVPYFTSGVKTLKKQVDQLTVEISSLKDAIIKDLTHQVIEAAMMEATKWRSKAESTK